MAKTGIRERLMKTGIDCPLGIQYLLPTLPDGKGGASGDTIGCKFPGLHSENQGWQFIQPVGPWPGPVG